MRLKLLPFLLIPLVVLFFSPCLQAQFLHWDDGKHIFVNPFVYGWGLENVLRIFQHTVNGTYIPLTILSYNIEYHIFGLKAWVIHLNNVLGHIGVAGLVFYLGTRLGLGIWAAFWASAIFALHPMHVESVAWATERKDTLYGIFYLLALVQYWNYIQQGRRRNYILSIVFALLSMLSKPMALSLPWMLLILDWWGRRPLNAKTLLEKLPFAALIIPLTAVTFFSLGPKPHILWPDSLLIWIWSFVFYLKKFFWPHPLLPLYVPQEPVTLANGEYAFAVWIFIGLGVLTWYLRRWRLWILAGAFYAGTIFFICRGDFADINIVADRFMYLSSIGICWLLGRGIERAQKKFGPIAAVIAALIVLALGLKTYQQCQIWRDDQSLFQHALKYEPKNSLARKKMKVFLYHPAQDTFDYKNFDRDIVLNPQDAKAYNRRGYALVAAGHPDLAMEDFNKAIALDPHFSPAYINRGSLLQLKNDYAKALADFDQAIRSNPHDPVGYLNKGITLAKMRQWDEALRLYNHALRLEPQNKEAYYRRALLWRQQNRCDSAIGDFNKTIELAPNFIDGYFYRGLCRAQLRQFPQAQADFLAAIRLDPTEAKYFHQMGIALFQQGQLEEAEKAYTQAIALDPYDDEPYNNRGLLNLKQNRVAAALADYTMAIETNHKPYRNYITRGDIYLAIGDAAKAMDDYTQAIYFSHGDAIALSKRAKLHFDLKQYSKALRDMNTVVKNNPTDPDVYMIRARIHRQMGNTAQALKDEHAAQNMQ